MDTNAKQHWEKIYGTKQRHEVSWWQDEPRTSLNLIHACSLPPTAHIIDIGGGDSMLVDFLLNEGYVNLTVLDISKKALERAKSRLGERAHVVEWIVCDILEFQPTKTYDLWHDRATFHFLTDDHQVNSYIVTACKAVKPGGHLVLATFSTAGPKTCSGLSVTQYDEAKLTQALHKGFDKVECITENHVTPFNTEQNFLFCGYRRQGGD